MDNWWHCDHTDSPRIQTCDVVRRCFQAFDATPHVDYLLMTQRPELVRDKWPTRWVRSEHEYQEDSFDNVILGVPVETQADIERLVPELLKCHDLCKGLEVICDPKEELDFTEVAFCDSHCDPLNGSYAYEDQDGLGTCYDDGPAINRIIVEGNEHPIHPDHVRSLRDQCLDANVKFNFASWGLWAPRENCPNGLDDGKGLENLCHYETHEGWVSGFTTAENQHMVRVGKAKSGRLLDGQEHNGRVS